VTEEKPKTDREQQEQAIMAVENQRAFRMSAWRVAGIETRMVGRDVELLMLQNMFRDATEDAEVHIVTVVGDAGVGKSRLQYEFEKWIELLPDDIYYFMGRATPESERVTARQRYGKSFAPEWLPLSILTRQTWLGSCSVLISPPARQSRPS
jgi:hypothetical protein